MKEIYFLSEHNIFIFLLQVFILLAFARGLGEIFRAKKLPAFTAEILVGILLGPTVFGRFLPHLHQVVFPQNPIQLSMLETVAWVGILFLLLETGLEVDFSIALKQGSDAFKIAITDIVVPMTVSFVACLFLPANYLVNPDQRIYFALFMATAMTISAMAVTARALHDLKLSKTDLGFLIVSALSINDIIGWLVFTLVLGLFTQVNPDLLRIFTVFIFTLGFAFICLSLGRKFANLLISKIKTTAMPQTAASLTVVCLLGLFCGVVTQKIGIHALFGFFIAGVMAGGAKALSERTRQIISQMVYAIFVPLFFASIGLKVDFLHNFDLFLVLFVTAISLAAKFLGAWLGVSFTQISRANRLSIAIAHIPGGMMEIIVGLLALEYNLITPPIFIALVCGAIISSLVLGPWLSYSIKRRKEVSVLEFFSSRGIIANIRPRQRDKAIYELTELIAEHEGSYEADLIYNAVLERENAMGTALEEGIAIPHARLPFLRRPIVAFGRSLTGIDWDSPDGNLTNFIFLILTPVHDDDTQVQILAAIAKAMSSKEARTAIIQAKGSEQIWAILRDAFTSELVIRK